MFEISDETHAETFSERRELAASDAGRKALLMDFIAVLHGKVMEGEMTDSNMLRAIQTAEKLHRTLSEPAFAPEATPETDDPEEDDPYAYDHTNLHRKLAEMSDDDLLSHVEGLVGQVEQKARYGAMRSRFTPRVFAGKLSVGGERCTAPASDERKRRT